MFILTISLVFIITSTVMSYLFYKVAKHNYQVTKNLIEDIKSLDKDFNKLKRLFVTKENRR